MAVFSWDSQNELQVKMKCQSILKKYLMLSGEHSGEWWLPGKKKYPGQLIIDEKEQTIRLEIFGTEFIEERPIKIPETYPEHFHALILGDSPLSTLYNCHWTGCSEIGRNLYRTTYSIEYVFTGVHFSEADIPVRAGTFLFPHLSTWYDGDALHAKLKGKQGIFLDGKHVVESVLSDDRIKVNDNLSLQLWDEVLEHIEEMNISYKVEYSKYIRFQYEQNIPFKNLLKDAITFLKLLSFCFGRPLNLFIIYMHVEKEKVETSDDLGPLHRSDKLLVHVNNYTLKQKKEIETHSYHGRHLLLSRHTCSKRELDQIIVTWFSNDRLYNIYEYYLDSNNWLQGTNAKLSNIMFNNRFLNLIQGLEDFYREHYETMKTAGERTSFDFRKNTAMNYITDPALKHWVNNTFKFTKTPTITEKLTTIVTELLPDIAKLFHGLSFVDFPQSAADFRNDLSHGKNKDINLGRRLRRDYYIAQVLLGVCILRSLGVNKLNERTAYYSKFEDAAYEVAFFIKSNKL